MPCPGRPYLFFFFFRSCTFRANRPFSFVVLFASFDG